MIKRPINKEKRQMIIVYLTVLSIILFAIAVYYIINSGKLNRGGGIVGDGVCGNFEGWDAQDNCCLNIHEGDVTIECVGGWNFNSENNKCGFECNINAICRTFPVNDRNSCCQNLEEGEGIYFNDETGNCEQILPPGPLDELTAEMNCEANLGGEWREFSNGCVDSCDYQRNPGDILCTQAFTFGCDCGPGNCLDLNTGSCEPI